MELEHHFNDRKLDLLLQVEKLVENKKFHTFTWACVWLADDSMIEDTVNALRTKPHILTGLLRGLTSYETLKAWQQRIRTAKNPTIEGEAETSTGQKRKSSTGRSTAAKTLCSKRDQGRCCLTGHAHSTEVAHIYPYCLAQNTEENDRFQFWELLRIFWTKDKIDAWHQAVFREGTETPRNLLTLGSTVHDWWARGMFALEPVSLSNDRKELKLIFHWLRRHETSQINISTRPCLSFESPLHGPDNKMLATNNLADPILKTGSVITLTTTDPDKMPLPDPDILNLQFLLQKLSAISGGAESSEHEEEEKDDGGNLGLSDSFVQDKNIQELFRQFSTKMPFSRYNQPLPTSPLVSIRGGGGGTDVNDEDEDPT